MDSPGSVRVPARAVAEPHRGMLQELDIEGYAVVDRLRLAFQPGLNLLTGETGSGKSIVVDSLALLFGVRASVDVVRSGARRARVSGIFEPPADAALVARLAESGIETEGELIIERQVLANGKSRAYVNGSPAKLALLRDLAGYLGDIHGQHEQQTLLSPGAQLRLVDSFAELLPDVEELAAVFGRWRTSNEALDRHRRGEQERLRRIDLLRYQADEIRAADPRAGEDDELRGERQRLANVESLRQNCFEASSALYDSGGSASAAIKSAAAALESISGVDPQFEKLASRLEDARSTVDDVAFEVREYAGSLEADPERQEAVEERLALLDKLKRKYGPAIDDVLEFGKRSDEELASLEGGADRVEALEREVSASADEYERRAKRIACERRKAAERLAVAVGQHLSELALEKARFQVEVEPLDAWGARGADRARFLFTANAGMPPRALGQVASGGELSRVALALKTCQVGATGSEGYRPTLVFDEIDTGVGGGVAAAIGSRLRALASGSQVLCVTHLPQIACRADAHFHVAKAAVAGQTVATVRELSESERVEEIARMLSGTEVTSAALENARQMLSVG